MRNSLRVVIPGLALVLSLSTCLYAGDRGGQIRQINQSGGTDVLLGKCADTEEPVSLGINVAFSGQSGRTVTDQNGINYNVWGMSFYENKVYPPMYWGVFPLYFFGDDVGVSLTVTNNSASRRAKLVVMTECYCLKTDGQNGASLLAPTEYDTTLNGGESAVIDATFGVQETADAESGLDRFLVKAYLSKAADGQGEHAVAGTININPNNNDDFEFVLVVDGGAVISRDTLVDIAPPVPGQTPGNTFPGYNGAASYISVMPKGSGNQNSLTVDGQPYDLQNGTRYVIMGDPMTVNLYKAANGNGHWYIDVQAQNATIGPDNDADWIVDDTEATELLLTKEAIFCPPELERALLEATVGLLP
jgi:hypothetical protein